MKFKIWTHKMAWAYVYMEESEYPPPPPPPGLTLSSPAIIEAFFVDFSFGGIMKLLTKFLTQPTKDILSVTWLVKCVLWSFNGRFIRSIFGTYSFCSLYTRNSYGKVRWFAVLCPLLSVTYALLMRFMRSLHVSRRPSSPPRQFSSPDDHRINIFLHFFCPFGVRYPYPVICDSTIRNKCRLYSPKTKTL